MANYTVKIVREVIEGLSGDTPLFGFIVTPADISVWDQELEGYRDPKTDEWAKVVEKAEELVSFGTTTLWDEIWSVVNDAISECGFDEAS